MGRFILFYNGWVIGFVVEMMVFMGKKIEYILNIIFEYDVLLYCILFRMKFLFDNKVLLYIGI